MNEEALTLRQDAREGWWVSFTIGAIFLLAGLVMRAEGNNVGGWAFIAGLGGLQMAWGWFCRQL